MASDDAGDKTEAPTERRRSEAREQGNIPKSTDLNAAVLMLTAASLLWTMGPTITEKLGQLVRAYVEGPLPLTLDAYGFAHDMWQLANVVGEISLPFLGTMFLAAIGANFLQIGFVMTTKPLEPKWNRVNPATGFTRIYSMSSLVKLGTNTGKITVFSTVAIIFIAYEIATWEAMMEFETISFLSLMSWKTLQLAFTLSIALAVLAVVDYAWQWYKHEEDLKMTKQEIRDEMKNMEGDPHIRHKRREIHRKLAAARQMADVPKADVIINNPTHISVAISYNPEKHPAPIVVAKGADEIAMRIREIAKEHKIPMIERKPLARRLYKEVKVGRPIPPDLYSAFVEIMSYVYKLTGKAPAAFRKK